MRVLILGGTTEASALARALAGDGRFVPLLSLAGRTRAPVPPPVPWRVGGFGGAAGLQAFIAAEGIDALIDATHPFAARMKANAAMVTIPRVAVVRPPWMPVEGDRWTPVANMADAAAALGRLSQTVFLTVGQGELAAFGPPHRYIVRSVDPPSDAPEGATIITARGPFSAADDQMLMTRYGVEVLITKNSGGSAVAGKLDAARNLGVRVIMVVRPPPPPGPLVEGAAGALRWLDQLAALRGV